MNKVLLIALSAVLCVACTAKKEKTIKNPTNKVSFSTSTETPSKIDNWGFFWQMPKIDKDAHLAYTVSIGEKEYFEYTFKRTLKPGQNIRSDFNNKLLKGQMGNFENSIITITLMVDKGKIEFVKKPNFRFSFKNNIKAKMN